MKDSQTQKIDQTRDTYQTATTDEFDLSQYRQSLKQLADDLQNEQGQPTMQVVYDPIQRVSYVRERTNNTKTKELSVQQIVRIMGQEKTGNFFNRTAKKIVAKITTNLKEIHLKDKIMSLRSVMFHSFKCDEIDWLQKHYSNYNKQELDQLPSEYVIKMKKIIDRFRFQIPTDKVYQDEKESVFQCLSKLQTVYNQIQHHSKGIFQSLKHRQKEYILIMMISAYKIFYDGYTTYKRSRLKKLFQCLESDCSSFNNSMQVLRFLESKDPLLEKMPPLSQMDLSLQVIKSIEEFKQINKLQFIKKNINLVPVSITPKRRKVVNLLISGFLSQDVDKRQQWGQLLACMPNSEVYGLQWKSNTINQLVKFLALSVKDMIMGKQVNTFLEKDNPFFHAFQSAIQSGQLLAYVIHKLFPLQFINIISYSLGSQLIRAFLEKSIELNGGININKVITMGGVSDIEDFQETLQKTAHSISILNIRSKHDSVLKYILKRSKPHLKPLGLNDINWKVNNHWVQNMDVSKKIKGHFSFMSNFGTIASLLMLNQE